MATRTRRLKELGRNWIGGAFALLLLLSPSMSPVPVYAANLATVGTCDEPHLRAAIAAAGSGGKVTFACSGTIVLAATLTFDSNTSGLTIDGTGHAVTISGGDAVRAFSIGPGVSLLLKHLTITHGVMSFGNGGGVSSSGNLTVVDTVFSHNYTTANCYHCFTNGGAIDNGGVLNVESSTFVSNESNSGGAISNVGTLNITNSTFSDNGAVFHEVYFGDGGAIQSDGALNITGSTFVNNQAAGVGGAIDGAGTLHLTNSTFNGNVDDAVFSSGNLGGGAISFGGTGTITNTTLYGNGSLINTNDQRHGNGGSLNSPNLRVSNSIIARSNFARTGGPPPSGQNCAVAPIDGGGNLEDGATCGFTTVNRSRSNVDLLLLPLASNGGATQTMALPATSPAIGFGLVPVCLSTAPETPVGNVDQRVSPRHADTRGVCDSGAYDTGANNPTLPSCELTGHRPGPPAQIDVTVQATAHGLQTIQVIQATNASFSMNPLTFTPGTLAPVVVTFTKLDQSEPAVVVLRVTDTAGNLTTCDPIETLVVPEHRVARQTFQHVPAGEHFVLLSNGNPGLRQLSVIVNGRPFTERALRSNQEVLLDVRAAMRPGTDNTIILIGVGERDSRAEVLIADQP